MQTFICPRYGVAGAIALTSAGPVAKTLRQDHQHFADRESRQSELRAGESVWRSKETKHRPESCKTGLLPNLKDGVGDPSAKSPMIPCCWREWAG